MRSKRFSRSAAAVTGFLLALVLAMAPRAEALLSSYLVHETYWYASGPMGHYDTDYYTLFVDPGVTNWIAWNHSPVLQSHGGNDVFYPGWIGTDDYFWLTVTAPTGAGYSAQMDYNTGGAVSSGQQNVIFGDAATTPDALRWTAVWSPGGAHPYLFDEAGIFNSVFTSAGDYTFKFDFYNAWCCSGGHGDFYLLVDTAEQVPEPSTLLLFGAGALGLLIMSRRRNPAGASA